MLMIGCAICGFVCEFKCEKDGISCPTCKIPLMPVIKDNKEKKMYIKQEIASGKFCNSLGDMTPSSQCIFLDRGSFIRNEQDSFVCRRHPGVTLGTEVIDNKKHIMKCRECMNDIGC